MHLSTICFTLVWFTFAGLATALPIEFETTTVTAAGDTALFHVQIPSNYDSTRPPAIIVGWHALGGSEVEIFAFDYPEICDQRGWILASHMGPNDRHWNTRLPQLHCRAMLDWLSEHFPFSRDSIYMCGASMGAAAGQVWHSNNCAFDDYLIAATAGGSQILDCQLRQEEYLASGDTNRSMRVAFGGLPIESDSVAYEYHRYSAAYFADTTESMHFNCLTVPIWSNWGAEQFEWDAYGSNAMRLAVLRQNGAESHFAPANWTGHGFPIMVAKDVCDWFARISANRFPDTLSLAADENGTYYYCDVKLRDSAFTFARWDIRKDSESKTLDLVFLQNVAALKVDFVFPWGILDTLHCNWQSIDPVDPETQVTLAGLPRRSVVGVNGISTYRVTADGELTINVNGEDSFVLTFDSTLAAEPYDIALVNAYPNPFNSDITLLIDSFERRSTFVEIYDVMGRLTAKIPVQLGPSVNRVQLSLPQLSSGVYWVRAEKAAPLKIVLIR